jgi:glucose-6-phosphate dehydrogenase assembly protein OpcA
MNLVVIAATPTLARQYEPALEQVVQHIPARAIVVGLDPDGEDELRAEVSAVCSPASGGAPLVCSERVSLVARGAICRRLPSCVDALCAPDVPMTLVWLARVHVDDPAFAPLARQASRIVLDAGQSSLSSLSHAVRWARSRPDDDRPGIADLAWTRMAPWQELCARMFDPARLRPLAERVTRISLAQAAPEKGHVGPEGALLLGWLATRLGWKAASLAGQLRLVRPDGGSVQTFLRTQSVGWAPRGTLLGLEIEASGGGVAMRGQVARGEQAETDAATWCVNVTSGGDTQRFEQRMRLRARDAARLLDRTLHRPQHDDALAEAVTWADEVSDEEFVHEVN